MAETKKKTAKRAPLVELQKAEEVKPAPPFEIKSLGQLEEERRLAELEARREAELYIKRQEAERYSKMLRIGVFGIGLGVAAFLGYRYLSNKPDAIETLGSDILPSLVSQ